MKTPPKKQKPGSKEPKNKKRHRPEDYGPLQDIPRLAELTKYAVPPDDDIGPGAALRAETARAGLLAGEDKSSPFWRLLNGGSLFFCEKFAESAAELRLAMNAFPADSVIRRLAGTLLGIAEGNVHFADGKYKVFRGHAQFRDALKDALVAKGRPEKPFAGFGLDNFWNPGDPAGAGYEGASLTPEMVASAEKKFGFKLPLSYVRLLEKQNGGASVLTAGFLENPELPFDEFVFPFKAFLGLDDGAKYSLGRGRVQDLAEKYGLNKFGLVVCDPLDNDDDLLFLDYRENGKYGEPYVMCARRGNSPADWVCHVAAKDFETFAKSLITYEKAMEERLLMWARIENVDIPKKYTLDDIVFEEIFHADYFRTSYCHRMLSTQIDCRHKHILGMIKKIFGKKGAASPVKHLADILSAYLGDVDANWQVSAAFHDGDPDILGIGYRMEDSADTARTKEISSLLAKFLQNKNAVVKYSIDHFEHAQAGGFFLVERNPA
ncbi:MAG: SMI1/KNR4 family protein [Deltaproteobacteria bacterium]|jgi:hypothetical protein|nr:SMI1/KNR4 family protein [Deltaproteobacteria bacterium]